MCLPLFGLQYLGGLMPLAYLRRLFSGIKVISPKGDNYYINIEQDMIHADP